MLAPLALLGLLTTAPASATEAAPLEARAAFARSLIEEAGLPTARLDDDQAVATAVLLLRADRLITRFQRRARRAEVSGERLMFSVEMRDGRVTRIGLDMATPVPEALVTRLARRLKRARATPDIDANVYFPVVL